MRAAPQPATGSRRRRLRAHQPYVSGRPLPRRRKRFQGRLRQRSIGFGESQKAEWFHVSYSSPIQATISRAISSAGMSFTTASSRCCLGSVTERKRRRPARLGALQRGHDGAHVHHADLRIVARLRQAAGGPAEHRGRRRRRPKPGAVRLRCAPESRTIRRRHRQRSTPWNCSVMPSRSPTICMVAPAPREPIPSRQKPAAAIYPGREWLRWRPASAPL
jgi:hypothetical protein